MTNQRQAMRELQAHLEEEIGVDSATAVVDHVDRTVTEDYLDRALADHSNRMMAAWRKDLLLVSVAQFFALAAAVGAIGALA